MPAIAVGLTEVIADWLHDTIETDAVLMAVKGNSFEVYDTAAYSNAPFPRTIFQFQSPLGTLLSQNTNILVESSLWLIKEVTVGKEQFTNQQIDVQARLINLLNGQHDIPVMEGATRRGYITSCVYDRPFRMPAVPTELGREYQLGAFFRIEATA